ncbi:HAD hydrolase-like protein [Micromonospora sp. RP3T]|uniref:HAD hydrolase-like protein n=1 Tax=Micromonospora sp. RP3T TaxID=2135446 RepID=UPI003D753B35
MPNRLVLWDIDGTLLEPAGFGWRLAGVAFRQLFGIDLAVDVPRAGRTDRAIYTDVLRLHDISVSDRLDPFCAAIGALAEPARDQLLRTGGHILPGAMASVRALVAEPAVAQSVLTGNLRAVGVAKLAAVDLLGLMDLSVAAFGDHHIDRADLVEVASRAFAQKYDLAGDAFETVLIGDTPLDIAAARSTGAGVVAVATGHYSPADLSAAGATVVLPDLTEPERVVEAVLGAPATHEAGVR